MEPTTESEADGLMAANIGHITVMNRARKFAAWKRQYNE